MPANDDHALAEKTAGLASRCNDLAVELTGPPSRSFLEVQDRLIKLQIAAIVKELNQKHAAYKSAIKGLDEAIDFIDKATVSIERIAKGIKLAAKAADLIEQAIEKAL